MSKPVKSVTASVIILNNRKVLLQQKWNDQYFAYCGGQMDLGEFIEKVETKLTGEDRLCQ